MFVNIGFIFGFSLMLVWLLNRDNKVCNIAAIILMLIYMTNFLFSFNKLYYQEDYDWIGLTHFLHQYQESHDDTLLVFVDPIYMFEPINYYSNFYGKNSLEKMTINTFKKLKNVTKSALVIDFLDEYPNILTVEKYLQEATGLRCHIPVFSSQFVKIKLLECNNKNE